MIPWITDSIFLLMMKKDELRIIYRKKRIQLSEQEIIEKNKAIYNQFWHFFDLKDIFSVHVFLPILKNNEIDTWMIIKRFINEGKLVIISKSKPETFEMISYKLTSKTIIQENRWGIPEPLEGEIFAESDIDMVIIPLLAFDEKGHRVGYGKGFYDRFLSKCRPDAVKAGLSFFPPVKQIEDIDAFDIPVDFVVTPAKVYSFQPEK